MTMTYDMDDGWINIMSKSLLISYLHRVKNKKKCKSEKEKERRILSLQFSSAQFDGLWRFHFDVFSEFEFEIN